MSENQKDDDGNGQDKTGVLTKTRPKTKKPSMYKVLMLNDDYTPMDFVVHILLSYFQKTEEEAVQIMLNVHQTGVGLCGVYSFEVAETKVMQVTDNARRNEHPLQCTLEKE
ncbi:MAG: ATP-dependent Clp protease adapter ClpS [Emcibacter sp.]|nr:ATP-dependent Clp protease adapter ClpS [Emcibacter sp.]